MHLKTDHADSGASGRREPLRRFLGRLLSREVMAIVAMGMALQALVFGVPKELHEFMRWTQIGVFALFTAEYAGGFLQAENPPASA